MYEYIDKNKNLTVPKIIVQKINRFTEKHVLRRKQN